MGAYIVYPSHLRYPRERDLKHQEVILFGMTLVRDGPTAHAWEGGGFMKDRGGAVGREP